MSAIATGTKLAAVVSTVLVLPLVILELVNRREFHEGFPVALFGLLWLLPMMFIVILTPIVQHVRSGNGVPPNRIDLSIRVVLLALIALAWASWMIDQMPCFLGVPNCD
jgi:hypothetical protein